MKYEILCAGIGGRGVLLASTVIIETAIRAGLHAIASDEYGMSQRGGSVVSLIKIGDTASPLIGRENADILLAFEESEFYRTFVFLKRGGLAVINTALAALPEAVETLLREREVRFHLLDADGIAGRHGMNQASNMALLGSFSVLSPEVFALEKLEESIRARVPDRVVEKNIRVLRDGWNLTAAGKSEH